MLNSLIESCFSFLSGFTNEMLMPIMIGTIFLGSLLRVLSYFTLKREEWFALAFQKRVQEYVGSSLEVKHYKSFFVMTKYLLEKTYYELFIVRSIMKRRNPDTVMAFSDRFFLVQEGCARIVRDTEKQVKYFRYDIHRPKMIEVSKLIFQNNPCFNKIFGILPIVTVNEIVSLLPGMIIIMGIFGTFVGIMEALPKVSQMDIADPESSKMVMDAFLMTISHSMKTAILGIFLSIFSTIINSIFNPVRVFVNSIERFENSMDMIWNACDNNKLPSEIENFNEHRDPMEALAEDALEKELGFSHHIDEVEIEAPPVPIRKYTKSA